MHSVDPPSKCRANGAASDFAFGKTVTVQTHGHNKYRRFMET